MNDPRRGAASRDSHVRIGDADRDHAINLLGVHFADGRLSITEYDERCQLLAGAMTRAEIDQQFRDLPVLPGSPADPPSSPGTDVAVYSAGEIAEQHRRGANPRAGIMALTGISLGAVAAVINGPLSVIPAALIAVVAILLYVMKVGPASWYVPTPEALERARVKKMRQAHQLQLEEKKAQRKIRQTEMTTDAIDMAHRAIGKAGRSVNNGWEQWRKRK